MAHVHVRLEFLLEVRRCWLLAVQARSRLAQPPMQADKHEDALPETAEEVRPPLLEHVFGPPSGDADHLHNTSHLPARKLHPDFFNDLLRGHRPNITHILEHPQLTRLEEQPPRPNGPLALVDLKGQHDGQHELPVPIPCEVWGQHFGEALAKLAKHAAVGIAVVHDLHQLLRTAILHLLQYILLNEMPWLPFIVRVEASDVVYVAPLQRCKQIV
mmetsp:Transcript_108262/g.279954  ORF Transcript_108262/g.279954 Transcript_108262/m.279954 type:complete len:215 (-) Transcript_108262:2234-2878(-)